jgi:hypothetical protein
MKKIYENPTTTVVKIVTNHLMVGSESIPVSETNYDGETTIESRRGTIWDDEEDDEYDF